MAINIQTRYSSSWVCNRKYTEEDILTNRKQHKLQRQMIRNYKIANTFSSQLTNIRYLAGFGTWIYTMYYVRKEYGVFKETVSNFSLFGLFTPSPETRENFSKIYNAMSAGAKGSYEVTKNTLKPGKNFGDMKNWCVNKWDNINGSNINQLDPYDEKTVKMEGEIGALKRKKKLLRQKIQNKSDVFCMKTPIEMYSEILDELSNCESGWKGSDHLPRVVVVGDQSAGKTSVLEMLVQARIFPRGAGQMMTCAPVKVTLLDGPKHVAKIKDDFNEYDLTNEDDLADLRKAVEMKMKKSLVDGKTVSKEVISMTVQGPGLNRMVLIDLPGIISTQTVGMGSDTKSEIQEMSNQYMNNPNAIILCIQDGSVDAERSNVTDLVSKCDPHGKRTIFVLTKVDMAEQNMADPKRIRKILSGKLFPMKALGYFAVVTGNGNREDSVENIRMYEEDYFKRSKLFRKGIIKDTQVTTANLSKAVADCFWKMVEESVEQQTDFFMAKKFNLEAEWHNTFPKLRELDRDELFVRAESEILDKTISLAFIPVHKWKVLLFETLWDRTKGHIFDNIYLPAAMSPNNGSFNTIVDIKLKKWTETSLLDWSIDSGQKAFQKMLKQRMLEDNKSDKLINFEILRNVLFEEIQKRHTWDSKVFKTLKVLQSNALGDKTILEKSEWDNGVKFLESSLEESIKETDDVLGKMTGPTYRERWLHWKYLSDDHQKRRQVKGEIEAILKGRQENDKSQELSYEETAVIKTNLKSKGFGVEDSYLKETWTPVYKRFFLQKSLQNAYNCRKEFYLYSQEDTAHETNCYDVVLFWRIHNLIDRTANELRQHITNSEVQRLCRTMKSILEDFEDDEGIKKQLIIGRHVELAEELKQVRRILEKLEDFIAIIKTSKKT